MKANARFTVFFASQIFVAVARQRRRKCICSVPSSREVAQRILCSASARSLVNPPHVSHARLVWNWRKRAIGRSSIARRVTAISCHVRKARERPAPINWRIACVLISTAAARSSRAACHVRHARLR